MSQIQIDTEEDSNDLPPPVVAGGVKNQHIQVNKTGKMNMPDSQQHKKFNPESLSHFYWAKIAFSVDWSYSICLRQEFLMANFPTSLILAYQSFGVVYGDLSTSPLYVYSSIFVGKLQDHQNPDTIFGAFSLIFWTLTLIPLLKYIIIILSADDSGEGGTFALYSLLCRHGKFSLLPNQQAADEELSAYKYGSLGQSSSSVALKRFLEKRKKLRTALLLVVLLGAGMVIGDGVVTPAMSVLSSVSGLEAAQRKLPQGGVRLLSCIILVGLFALQHCGTHRVGFMFAPVVIVWLISIFAIGLYNTIQWNPKIVYALSPHYIIKFFGQTGKDGWISLGGVLLSITGTEAMFADLGHFSARSIRIAFIFLVYPCLVMQYMGQAAYLSKNISSIPTSFYDSVPDGVFWPVFVIATLAAIVGSQAIISATFSIIKQCHALGCFPRVKVVHTSKQIHGQIYIPEINWILMILTLAVAVGFRDTTTIGNAYVIVVGIDLGILDVTSRIPHAWPSCHVSDVHYDFPHGTRHGPRLAKEYNTCRYVPRFLLVHRRFLPVSRIYKSPPRRMGLPRTLLLLHVRHVRLALRRGTLPYWPNLPRPYRMYRCIVRYGYKDLQGDDGHFENQLIQSIAEFIQMEAVEPQFSSPDTVSYDGRMAVISSMTFESGSSLVVSEVEEFGASNSIQSSKSLTLQSLRSAYDDENPRVRRRHVRFQIPQDPGMDPSVKEELLDLIQAKEAGVAYIMGHSYIKARRSSSFLKKLVIDFGYSFLRKNCRGPSVALHIPHISLIEVGMIYHV
ncbi:hypothetical protein DH2020_004913 [Rehmannia glutinosa]|uniref:Potassium transporter n=1 Tax=Rehmannia glutinosa TaxID=99300 RepID=A0ABR0XQQ8_REHGL